MRDVDHGLGGLSPGRTCSKAARRGKRALVAAAVLLAVAGAAQAAERARPPGRQRPTPSGFPVPRWVSLKFGKVNARQGPGDDYPAVWTYEARRLPVQVIAETREWRRVCDSDGQTAWVHRRTVDGARTVFRAAAQPVALNARPDAKSPVRAWLAAHAIAELDTCDRGWCRVRVQDSRGQGMGGQDVRGWAPARELWGTGEAQRCR